MNSPSRFEIETLAVEIHQVHYDQRLREYAEEEARALEKVRATHNLGGYLPALVACASERVRAEILKLADAWVEAFNLFGAPSTLWAEKTLDTAALQMVSGRIAAVREQLKLTAARTRQPVGDWAHLEREISHVHQQAVREGKLRLKRQRIAFNQPTRPGPKATDRVPITRRVSNVSEAPPPPPVPESGDGGEMPRDPTLKLDAPGPIDLEYNAQEENTNGSDAHRAWFVNNIEKLEKTAESVQNHFTEDEQNAQRIAVRAAIERFDELASEEYRRWMEERRPLENFSTQLDGAQRQVSASLQDTWAIGSDRLTQWFKDHCARPTMRALDGRLQRWKHRAQTALILRGIGRDGGLATQSLTERLRTLITEETARVPGVEDGRRLAAWVHDDNHHLEGGYSGEFLERVRLLIAGLGSQFEPNGTAPMQFCLRMVLRELVCEREPLPNPQLARLNSEQLRRYLWAPYIDNSNTPESGKILNLCECLGWYCHRLMGLLQFEHAAGRTGGAVGPALEEQRSSASEQGADDEQEAGNSLARHWQDPIREVRAASRQKIVMPILKGKRWKPGRLATKAGVGKNSVYQYLDGTRATITEDNRTAIAEALEIKLGDLPD